MRKKSKKKIYIIPIMAYGLAYLMLLWLFAVLIFSL